VRHGDLSYFIDPADELGDDVGRSIRIDLDRVGDPARGPALSSKSPAALTPFAIELIEHASCRREVEQMGTGEVSVDCHRFTSPLV
jgi:hypothetical protein